VSAANIVADVCLGLAVLLVLACSLGVLVMRDTYQRLHFVGPISIVAPLLVGLAVTVSSGWHEATGASWMAIAIVVVSAPFLSHATMRAARIHAEGDWRQPASRDRQNR
jgi:multisubunit Na+/H+ antiporter MnhG subunit